MQDQALINDLVEFLDNYYRDEIGEFVQHYPQERQSLNIEYRDLYRWDSDFADDLQQKPDEAILYLEEALANYDLPIDISLEDAHVRVTDSEEYIDPVGVGQLDQSHLGRYIALRCQIGKVSERKPRLKMGAFECQRCGHITEVPQSFTEAQEPGMCQSCERQGPFRLDDDRSEWVDQRKLRLEAPPEKQSGAEITAYCLDDVADPANIDIQKKAGSRVTVLGKLEADMSSLFGRGSNEPVADEYFVPKAFVWGDNLTNDIAVDEYRSEVEGWASRDDAVQVFKRNIDTSLVITDDWEDALEMATVWLFAAPRIDPEVGTTVRGDIHMLFVSDPGMNKSDFAQKLADLSPKSVMKDSEGMSSEVALTAAATRGGFGDENWSIEPGALPKANKGHLILDEIDKGPDGFLNGIHSPLEGEQTLHVEKAGQEANLSTRCGFLALGNPSDGRFNEHDPIAEQVDLHPALMSRFDLVCTMEDHPDVETDEEIAEGVLDSIDESARVDFGDLDEQDTDKIASEVPRDVMQAWVKLARTEICPLLSEDAKDVLKDFYIDTRQLNGQNADEAPATARKLVSGVRIAMAYARCELSDTVKKRHAERAVDLSKTIVANVNLDPETGKFDKNRGTEAPSSQKERTEAVITCLRQHGKQSIDEIAAKTGIEKSKVQHRIEKLSQQGKIIEPVTGEYRCV